MLSQPACREQSKTTRTAGDEMGVYRVGAALCDVGSVRQPRYEMATPMMHERTRRVIDVAVSCASCSLVSSCVSRPMVSIGGMEMKLV